MSIKARRKNLRMHNLDSSDIQGNHSLMIRAAQQEALAPSSPTIGTVHDAICLFAFKIRDDAPNVPPIQPIKRHVPAGGDEAEKAARAGKWRIAAHALIGEYSSDSLGPSGMEHAAHCLPNPFEQDPISKSDYVRLAKRYPIYVGGYLAANGRDPISSNDLFVGMIQPGTALRVRDNDVQGGMHGTILQQLDTGDVETQFRSGDLRGLFDGSEGALGSSADYGPVTDQYQALDTTFWELANVIDVSQPWSALDAAESLVGPNGERGYVTNVQSVSPVPELAVGWNVVQRWTGLNLGSGPSADDDSVDVGRSAGHTYLAHKAEAGTVTVVQSSKTTGYRNQNLEWGGTVASGDVTGYSVMVSPIALSSDAGMSLLGTTEFAAWVSDNKLPCCTFVACFLQEASEPGRVDFNTAATT